MINLSPIQEINYKCPYCKFALTERGYLIPGMRNLADLYCASCGGEFYGDLPAGQALYTPILLDKKNANVFDDYGVGWFSEWLKSSYINRSSEPLKIEKRRSAELKEKVLLLNCLDVLYGHSLLKLLNAQHYIDKCSDVSLIVMIPSFLEWMLPEGIIEAWIVELPLRRGTEWNDWLADEIKAYMANFSEVYLSQAFSHPHPSEFDIERFTRIAPFSLDEWEEKVEIPRITFIWRDDRLWEDINAPASGFDKFKRQFGANKKSSAETQVKKIIEYAKRIRSRYPKLDFAVVGLGEAVGFPEWISDLRLTKLNAESEHKWCSRYAQSHIVIGVHGSNMLLPSAHAGSVIEFIGEDRLGNYLQDILFRPSDIRDALFRYRFVSHSTTVDELTLITETILHYKNFQKLMSYDFTKHQRVQDFSKWLSAR